MRDYLVIVAEDDAGETERLAVRDRLVASGAWRAPCERRGLSVLVEAAAPPAYRHLPGLSGALIGEVFEADAARQGLGADFRTESLAGLPPRSAAWRLARSAYGRYLAVFTEGSKVWVLRDPLGALEAVAWRRGGLGFIASRLPQDRTLWPVDLAVDWTAIGQILRQKNLASHLSPLTGVLSVEPGVFGSPWAMEEGERLWRPAWYVEQRASRWPSPAALERVVDGATAAYALGRDRIVCEISGGLDSAIVAASLKRSGVQVDYAINHSWPQAEADERAYALAAADDLGVPLEVVDRELLRLDAGKLARAAGGPRPNYVGGDPDHDAELAARLAGDPPAALFTGRGGDAVFYQMPALELVLDLTGLGRCGAPRLWGLSRLAARMGATVWSLARQAQARVGDRLPDPPASSLLSRELAAAPVAWHPWLQDLQDLSPTKRVQLRAIVNSLSAFGESQRHRAGDILDPLLAQPVVETCLAVPAVRLAVGATDRPFARRAFARRLPPSILARQGKGDLSVFFARSLSASRSFLRDYLIDGRLAAHGLLDRGALSEVLDPDYLIWRNATPDLFVALALEAWVRCWEERLAAPAGKTSVSV